MATCVCVCVCVCVVVVVVVVVVPVAAVEEVVAVGIVAHRRPWRPGPLR